MEHENFIDLFPSFSELFMHIQYTKWWPERFNESKYVLIFFQAFFLNESR